jgi:hypothetical protein
MDRRVESLRRILVPLALVLVSAVLHGLMIAGLSLRWPAPGPASVPAPAQRTVEVALVAGPAAAAPPPPAPAPAPPQRAAAPPAEAPRARADTARRPPPVARSVPAAPTQAPAAPITPISPGEWGGEAPAAAAASDTPPPLADAGPAAGDVPSEGPVTARDPGGAPVDDAGPTPRAAPSAGTPGEPSAGPPGTEATTVAGAAPVTTAPDETAGAAPLPPLPESHTRVFRVYWGDYTEARSVARLEYRLLRSGERYEIRTEGEAEGLISLVYSGTLTQHSTGRIAASGLAPTRYVEQRGKRPERGITLDPDAQRLHPVGGGAPVPMPPGTQDRLSVFYQLGLLARARPERFAAGSVIELPVATMREVRTERFTVVGDDLLSTARGAVRALHLSRPPPPGTDDPRIDLWLGYDFDMLPVRLRIEDSGRRVLDQVIDG